MAKIRYMPEDMINHVAMGLQNIFPKTEQDHARLLAWTFLTDKEFEAPRKIFFKKIEAVSGKTLAEAGISEMVELVFAPVSIRGNQKDYTRLLASHLDSIKKGFEHLKKLSQQF